MKDRRLLRAGDIAERLGINSNRVYERFKDACVQQDKKPFYYDPEVFERLTHRRSLKEMLNWCKEEFSGSDSLVSKVRNLVVRGSIRSEQPRGRNTTRYLPIKSQKMIENIFRHVRNFKENFTGDLIGSRDAARELNIDPIVMNYLLNTYGEEFSLTANREIPVTLGVVKKGRYGYEIRIPYVKWVGLATDAPRFLTAPIVNNLKRYSGKIRTRRKKSWVRKVTELVRAEERKRRKYIYFNQ